MNRFFSAKINDKDSVCLFSFETTEKLDCFVNRVTFGKTASSQLKFLTRGMGQF